MSEVKVEKNSKKEGWAKFLSDFLPLIVFVAIYKNSQDQNPILLATFDAQNLSSKKYHTALASGSTIASVSAIIKETSAIKIRTVIAITK